VANLSLASTVAESYRTDPLDAAAEQAWLNGIVVVAAAGNSGDELDAVDYAPGNDPYVISVGAMDDRGTKGTHDDRLAGWSSHGVTQDGFTKPEVLAPGTQLTAPTAPNSDYFRACRNCIVDRYYFQAGGTSMSAAVVSGAVALILERHPHWTPDQVKGALQSTLREVRKQGDVIDVPAAMKAARLVSNAGLVPNELILPGSGLIDYARASFRRASFRQAGDLPDAGWSRASFRCDCSLADDGSVDPTRASFRRASFRDTVGFHK
jgi:serine protease AprX